MKSDNKYEIIIIGGGFYGCCLALLMRNYYKDVAIVERSNNILLRASAINQARVHSGFHYPRNLTTAYRSLVNFPRFTLDFRHAIIDDHIKLYAIARSGSKVNASRFFRMFKDMKAEIEPAKAEYSRMFSKKLIEQTFQVREYIFDSNRLRALLKEHLTKKKIHILYETEVQSVNQHKDGESVIAIDCKGTFYEARQVFNCSYSRINILMQNSGLPLLPLKHEITEICLVDVPNILKKFGITVMDGPFFSIMPYPTENLHSLTHVRYTPHASWVDEDKLIDGYHKLNEQPIDTNFIYMRNDAQRYLPMISQVEHRKSFYEVKTVLRRNEIDDGRPILFHEHYGLRNFHVVLGSKIDNIYDLLEVIGEIKKVGKGEKKIRTDFFN